MKTIYEEIGGQVMIDKIVDTFYPKVYADKNISHLFQGDIEEIKRKQRMFLPQLFGGPALYSQEFGPPAMRDRHMPFEITPSRAESWLRCMKETLQEVGIYHTEAGQAMFQRFVQIAFVMINTEEYREDEREKQ